VRPDPVVWRSAPSEEYMHIVEDPSAGNHPSSGGHSTGRYIGGYSKLLGEHYEHTAKYVRITSHD
jgi:hypothetical protein